MSNNRHPVVSSSSSLLVDNPEDLSNLIFAASSAQTSSSNSNQSRNKKNKKNKKKNNKTNDDNRNSKLHKEMSYVGPIRVTYVDDKASSSSSSSSSSSQRQRILVATRKIVAGELLFVTPPTVQANVKDAVELWKQRKRLQQQQQNQQQKNQQPESDEESATATLLEECSEDVLVSSMEHALKQAQSSSNISALGVARSFTCLTGSTLSEKEILPSLERLNGMMVTGDDDDDGNNDVPPPMTRQDLLQIVRHNAFGPDGLNSYRAMEQALLKSENNSDEAGVPETLLLPPRLLGIYPLAAMMNHSCQANAVRVFTKQQQQQCDRDDENNNKEGGIMMVHALCPIQQGEEIVWSYISPTQDYARRQATLQQQYGFTCTCVRCETERTELFLSSSSQDDDGSSRQSLLLQDKLQAVTKLQQETTTTTTDKVVRALEQDILTGKQLGNTFKAYLRLSYLPAYIQHLNQVATSISTLQAKEALLLTAMQLHLACCMAHYASTEHISILHWCYMTVSQLHSAPGADPTKTMPKVRFWTEQLKQVHMVRFGRLGNSLERVRQVMKETRMLVAGGGGGGGDKKLPASPACVALLL